MVVVMAVAIVVVVCSGVGCLPGDAHSMQSVAHSLHTCCSSSKWETSKIDRFQILVSVVPEQAKSRGCSLHLLECVFRLL